MQHYGRVRLTAYIVTGLWSLAILVAGVQLSSAWSKILSCVPLLVVAGFAIFDNALWRVGPIKRLIHRPQLNGTWKGSLISMRPDESGREVEHAPIPIFISIWQTYLTLSICLISAESKSRSITPHLEMTDPTNFVIHYHYGNLPGLRVRDKSPAHSGGARIEIGSLTPAALSGEYWSDRRTRGTFTVKRVSKRRYGNWDEAVIALGKPEV